jgi:hypothetical protein
MVGGKNCIVGRLDVRLQWLYPLEALVQHRIERHRGWRIDPAHSLKPSSSPNLAAKASC